jgi:hypothetical protein
MEKPVNFISKASSNPGNPSGNVTTGSGMHGRGEEEKLDGAAGNNPVYPQHTTS